ncbi:MAG: PspC domain-containing protein [Pseudomonadota bacterium]
MSNNNYRRFYRDRSNRKIAGVCAGLADYFGFDLTVTRILAVIALLVAPPPVIILYLGIVFLVPARDNAPIVEEPRRKFRTHLRSSPSATVTDVKRSLLRLDARLAKMERVVTSPRFDLDRKIRNL